MANTKHKLAKDLDKTKEYANIRDEIERNELEEFKNSTGERLRDCIDRKKLSVSEFSKKCNLSYDTVKKYVNKNRLMRADNVVKMAKQLGVSCDYMLGADNDISRQKGLMSHEIIESETNLSSDTVSVLLSLKNDKDYIDCIDTLIGQKVILDKFVKYLIFLKNKGVYSGKAKDEKLYKRYTNHVERTEAELNNIPEYENLAIGETIDLKNVYLYQLMKEIEKAVESKIEKNM